MSKKFFTFISFYIVLCFFLKPAISYGGLGHALTGSIAEQLLSPEEKEFFQSFLNLMSEKYKLIEVFSEATRWADDLRWSTHKYDYWHYIQICYSRDLTKRCKNLRSPNSLTAMNESLHSLLNKNETKEKQGFYLLFVLHLLGDIHQPLHNIMMFDENNTRGDYGGNRIQLKYGDVDLNLHKFWDDLCVVDAKNPSRAKNLKEKARKEVEDLASQYINNYTFSAEELAFNGSLNIVESWIQTNHQLAIKYAYDPILMKTRNITDEYAQQCRKVVDRMVALAGMRLASVLKFLYKHMQEKI